MNFQNVADGLTGPLDPNVLRAMIVAVASFVRFSDPGSTDVSWTVRVEGAGWYKVSVEETDPIEDDEPGIELAIGKGLYRWN